MNFSIFDLDTSFTEFEIYKASGLNTVWFDANALSKQNINNDEQFASRFSYIERQHTLLFEGLPLCEHDARSVFAERYGGAGLNGNGGGSRCATDGEFHIKGAGITPTLGKGVPESHRSGTVNMRDALVELILSKAINQLTPLGTAKYYGVICTGDKTARWQEVGQDPYYSYGALVIREAAIRPAHFLRAGYYEPSLGFPAQEPDVSRVQQINLDIKAQCGSDNHYLLYLGKFLAGCANQFAFSRLHRLAHFSVTPSNILMDGRWIDLSSSSFVDAKYNYVLASHRKTFFAEDEMPVKILFELAATYEKYNNTTLNIEPLLRYYQEQLVAYRQIHTLTLLGLSFESASQLKKLAKPMAALEQSIARHFSPSKSVRIPYAPYKNRMSIELTDQDPVLQWIEAIFKGLSSKNKQGGDIENFRMILQASYATYAEKNASLADYSVAIAINALKKTYYSCFFYNERLTLRLQEIRLLNDIKEYQLFTQECIAVAEWALPSFSQQTSSLIIYQDHDCSICFDTSSAQYILQRNTNGVNQRSTFPVSSDVLDYLDKNNDLTLVIANFNFEPWVRRLLQILSEVERNA